MKNLLKLFSLFSITLLFSNVVFSAVWVIAIDPGHGGKDPGAISRNLKIYEKNVTISIARELKALLDRDPNFCAVLTRKGDYYISVPERSEIARKNKANYLISIHADSSGNPDMRGASVWVLSNRRASDEMGQWLEDHEKQSELLGGAGKVLASHNEKYLNQTVLDLQFAHSQRAGYELGDSVLRRFSKIANLSRNKPQHASLGVLRSPDIPSILVETGFLSNKDEESKLNSPSYRRKIAQAIYAGLVEYRKQYAAESKIKPIVKPLKIQNTDKSKYNKLQTSKTSTLHTVKSGESLLGLAAKYKVNANDILKLNKLKSRNLLIGQRLKIPQTNQIDTSQQSKERKTITKLNRNTEKIENAKPNSKNAIVKGKKADNISQIPHFHIVEKNQTLYAISRLYGINPNKLLKLNKLKEGKLIAGQKIRLKE